ncbi:MAG: TRAP transporter small permease [Alphaproteobacteria bacterium]
MRALATLYSGFFALIGLLCGLLIGWVVLSITIDVAIRVLRWGTLSWAMEVNEYAIYVVTALGAPWALHRGAHVRVDLLVKAAPVWLGRIIEVAADLIGAVASAALAYYAWAVASAAIRDNARLIKILIIPEWWVYAVIAFGAALMVVEFARRLVVAAKEGPHLETAPTV